MGCMAPTADHNSRFSARSHSRHLGKSRNPAAATILFVKALCVARLVSALRDATPPP